jgi:SynChlorMet cassette protein ScmC
MRMRLGPLRYEFQAWDAWGERTLARLGRHLDCRGFVGSPTRVLHLVRTRLFLSDRGRLAAEGLPDPLAAFLARSVPRQGWRERTDHTGYLLWHHHRSIHAIWSFGLETPHHRTLFQLPWYLILRDMVHRGGGVLHAGVTVWKGRGYLFTAPPGGGKTTALGRIPSPWKVLSDDTSLIWPERGTGFRVSPLPSWSILSGTKKTLPSISTWKPGISVPLCAILLLRKSEELGLTHQPGDHAARALYQALSEFPAVLINRDSFRKDLFHVACAVARRVPLWEMQTTLRGDFWRLIQNEISGKRKPSEET